MKKIIHNYSNLAGQIVHWDTSDNQEGYERNLKDAVTKQRLTELGWVDTDIEYRYNSYGFRTEEFDRQFDVVCFGCSFTMGTGVPVQDTWPAQLQQKIGLKTANLGHAGSSNDTAFRFAEHYLRHLKPKFAIWLQTDMHRIEIMDDAIPLCTNILASDTSNPFARDQFVKTWFSSLSNQILNQKKNSWAFQHLCRTLNITPLIFSRDHISSGLYPYGAARDLRHPGRDDYSKLVQHIMTALDQLSD